MENRSLRVVAGVLILLALLPAGCGKTEDVSSGQENEMEKTEIAVYINDEKVDVIWEDNETADALKESCPLTVDMSMYGGFEQVGSLGKELPSDDSRITTGPGDIVLYQGDQIVVFYGSNTWSYTRIGKIDMDEQELLALLGNGDVALRLEVE